ncbi:nuclear membrane protein [Cryptococcus neoformans Ze90-1]|nr:nuclear membrane protein [Cryptococcus neoformans var. grubii Ze90-1]
MEPRDRSAPMDIDPPVYNTDRLDAFVYKHDDGPARKRLHTELEHQPFHPQPTQGFAQFNSSLNSAPLLLAALNTPKKAPAYDPSQWYSQGARTPATSLVTQEVDMDSPARRGPSSETAGSVDEPEKGGDAGDKENATEERKPRKFAKGAVTRTNRKRQQSKKEQMRSDGDDRGAMRHGDSATPAFTKSEHHYSVHMAAPSLRHSEIPALLLGYLQFFVNTSIVLFCIYLAILFVLTVRRDVKDKMNEYSVEILQEIAECTNMYLTNMCSSNRIPHMDAPCRAWEACMNRDPTVVGRINIIAETFAGVINSFVEPISWKTMSFTLVTLTFLVILTNSALFNLRARASQHDTSAPAAPAFWPPHGQFMPQLPANIPHAPMVHAQGEGGEGEARQIGWSGEKGKHGW